MKEAEEAREAAEEARKAALRAAAKEYKSKAIAESGELWTANMPE